MPRKVHQHVAAGVREEPLRPRDGRVVPPRQHAQEVLNGHLVAAVVDLREIALGSSGAANQSRTPSSFSYGLVERDMNVRGADKRTRLLCRWISQMENRRGALIEVQMLEDARCLRKKGVEDARGG